MILIKERNVEFYHLDYKRVLPYKISTGHIRRIFSARSPPGSCGRVVKALDLKSNGFYPRRFEPCQLRNLFFISMSFLLYTTIKNRLSLLLLSPMCKHFVKASKGNIQRWNVNN